MSCPHLLLLVPYSQGFMIYRRAGSEELQHLLNSPSPYAVLTALHQLPQPRIVALLDRFPPRLLGELLLRETDLCLIPQAWVKHIPCYQPDPRARFTLQLLEAFLQEPMRLLANKATERVDL